MLYISTTASWWFTFAVGLLTGLIIDQSHSVLSLSDCVIIHHSLIADADRTGGRKVRTTAGCWRAVIFLRSSILLAISLKLNIQ